MKFWVEVFEEIVSCKQVDLRKVEGTEGKMRMELAV